MDFYEILGVSPSAGSDEIKRAYHRLAFKYHPDRNHDPRVEVRFKEITEAYNTLSDPDKRRLYDARFSDVFKDIFPQSAAPRHRDPKYRPKNPGDSRSKSKPTQRQLMKQYLPKVFWLNAAGAFLVLVIMIDFLLPLREETETFLNTYKVTSRRGQVLYDVLVTDRGTELKLYDGEISNFELESDILIQRTPVFATIRYITNGSGFYTTERMGIYGPPGIIPGILIIIAALALLFRSYTEFAFNASIVSGVLIVVSLCLIVVL